MQEKRVNMNHIL